MADSILTAATKFAEIANLPWPKVYNVYKALQGDAAPCLPKSTGRQIHFIRPIYMARLLLGVLAWRAGVNPAEANEVFSHATLNGEPLLREDGTQRPYLEWVIHRILTDGLTLVELKSFTFIPSRACVYIEHSDAELSGEYRPQDEETQWKWYRAAGMISSSATASPMLFNYLKMRIEWADPHEYWIPGEEPDA